jgi:anti-sigma factor RsiW
MPGFRAHVRFAMDHRWAPEQMSAFVDQDLAPRQRTRMERHLAECRRCRRLLAGLRLVVAALRRLPVPREGEATRILASVRVRLSEPPSP